jgi:hypothetical protein
MWPPPVNFTPRMLDHVTGTNIEPPTTTSSHIASQPIHNKAP